MANKKDVSPTERSRVRFMLVDFDGPSADLQQLAQTFAHAVKASPPVVVALPPPVNGPVVATATPAQQNANTPGLFDEVPDAEVVQANTEEKPAASKTQNGTKRKYKSKTPSVISDLEFSSGAKSLKDYIQEQAPTEHTKRYLAITQWLKEFRGITEVGANHIYSCYRDLGMTVPDDITRPLRKLRSQGWVEKGSAPSTFKIMHVGEGKLIQAPAKE
jgi:hypothetical protein